MSERLTPDEERGIADLRIGRLEIAPGTFTGRMVTAARVEPAP